MLSNCSEMLEPVLPLPLHHPPFTIHKGCLGFFAFSDSSLYFSYFNPLRQMASIFSCGSDTHTSFFFFNQYDELLESVPSLSIHTLKKFLSRRGFEPALVPTDVNQNLFRTYETGLWLLRSLGE